MAQRLTRMRSAIGIGLTWAAAWGGVGALVTLGLVLRTGRRPDPPFPLLLAVAGLLAGLLFTGALNLLDGRRRLAHLSLQRSAAWGAAAGALLACVFVLAVTAGGDPTFLQYLAVLAPLFAVAGAGSAAGSWLLARRVGLWTHLLDQ